MMTKRYFFVGALVLMLLVVSLDAWALTPFARKYQTSCITCHEAFPRFNSVGEAFRRNGYKFVDDDLLIKQEPLELGDEAHKRLWPESIWPNDITQVPPVAFGMKWIAEFQTDPQTDPVTGDTPAPVTFIFPHEIELAWPGTLGEHISFYGDMIFRQEDYATGDPVTWLMLKGWVEFEDLFGMENMFNFRLGTVGTHSMGLITARDEQTLSIQFYNFNTWMMPDLYKDDQGLITQYPQLKSFSGNSFDIQGQTGIELNGFGKRWLYHVGIVTGNIINPNGAEPSDDIFIFGAGDNTSSKDYYLSLGYKIGGLSFEGPELKDDIDVDDPDDQKAKDKILKPSQAEFWHDDSITFSFFGYKGTGIVTTAEWDTPIKTMPTSPYTLRDYKDHFFRLGVGIMPKYKDLTLNAGYMYGKNSDPYGPLSNASVDSHAWFVEVFYFAYPWMIPYGRYEGLNFDGLPSELTLDTEQDREILTLGCKAYIRANISLQIEGTYYPKDAGNVYALDKTIFFMLTTFF